MLKLMFRILHFRYGDDHQNRQLVPPEAEISSILVFLIERDQICGVAHLFISVGLPVQMGKPFPTAHFLPPR